MLRNRFLNTASFLLAAPDDKGATGGEQGKSTVLNENVGAEDDQGAQGDATGEQQQDAAQGDVGDDAGDDGKGAEGDDEDADLADLPPEVKAKAKAAIDKRMARETGWRDRQIDRLYRKTRETQEDNRALETIADPARRGAAPAKPGETLSEAEINRRADERAKVLTAQQQYDRDANDADARGRTSYGDKWGTTIAKLPKLGGVDINDMVDILNTDQPHVVLYQLADPDTYERVMALPPARRRNEFVKLAMKEAPKPRAAEADSRRPSDAVAPVRPLQGGRRTGAQQVNLYDDKADDDAWYAARNAERRKKFSNVE